MAQEAGLRVERVTTCLLCGKEGQPLYHGLRDRLFGAPGAWDLSRCPACALAWLNPRPVTAEMPRLYPPAYSAPLVGRETGGSSLKEKLRRAILMAAFDYEFPLEGAHWRRVGWLASRIRPLREMVGMSIMYLNGGERGRLLDVGCGNGRLLGLMRSLGWDVLGVEPDPGAARVAREHYGVPVIAGTLETAAIPERSVDVVSLHHVLEHVRDPISLLKECHRVLREGGTLVVVTPNVESLGHRVFRESWRGLEPPRHLYLFSMRALEVCTRQSGFRPETLRTVAASARRIWEASRLVRCANRLRDPRLPSAVKLEAWVFQMLEEALWPLWRRAGEEIFLVATKSGEGREV